MVVISSSAVVAVGKSSGADMTNAPRLSGPGRRWEVESASYDGHRAAVPVEKSAGGVKHEDDGGTAYHHAATASQMARRGLHPQLGLLGLRLGAGVLDVLLHLLLRQAHLQREPIDDRGEYEQHDEAPPEGDRVRVARARV